GDKDCGRAIMAQFLSLAVESGGGNPQLGEERRIAEDHTLALDHTDRAFAARRIETENTRKLNVALLRGRDDRRCKRVLARLLDARRKAQHRRLIETESR